MSPLAGPRALEQAAAIEYEPQARAIVRAAQRALEAVAPVFLGRACFTPLGTAYFGIPPTGGMRLEVDTLELE